MMACHLSQLALSLSLSIVTAMKLFLFIIGSLIISPSTCDSLDRAEERRRLQQQETAWHSDLIKTQKPSLTATNPDDVKALKAFYNATNGDYWSWNTGWLNGDPCQDLWYGLYCNNSDRVLRIALNINNMTGTLPAELAKADALQQLYIPVNSIGGMIPAEILSMKSMQNLVLSDNRFTGLSTDAISMPNLTGLELSYNQLHGPLPTYWDAPQLQVLDLGSNNLTGPLLESIGNLTNLQTLDLSENNFTGTFPSSWGNLGNLQQLKLYHNNFDSPSIPSSWEGMNFLFDIELDNVKGTLPSWIGSGWPQLQFLSVVDGSLTGDLPTSLCDLHLLQSMYFTNNSLTGKIPTCLCEMPLLEIGLSDNQLTGPIPYCIGRKENLFFLSLARNKLSGALPESIGYPYHMVVLDVSNNGLYGAIPSSISNLTNIYNFVLSNNKFSAIEDGLEDFFKSIRHTCKLGNNPWSCPLPSYLPKDCGAECSKCNTGDQHDHCSSCVEDSACGWCNEGPNCLEGSSSGPDTIYTCKPQDWTYGTSSQCP